MSRALVIIDIQNDYFPGGKMELVGSEAAAGRAQELLSAFRDSGEPVFHIQHVWDADDAPFFAPETEGVQIYSALRPQGDERHIVKHHANSFLETPLEAELRSIGASDVVLCGMMTSMCVDASARAAADLGFNTAIAADACAAPNLPSGGEVIAGDTVHKAFLAALGSMVADVRPTSELLGARSG
jgi:nicotinamidase-related amidase